MSAALLLFQLYLEHCFDDGVCVSCTCSACWRRYLCVVLISEKVYVAWDVCVAIALCGHSNIGHALRLCLSTTSTRRKGQGARCKGQDQHQCKLVRDAATTFNYNHNHYHRPGPIATQHNAAITATCVRVCKEFMCPC